MPEHLRSAVAGTTALLVCAVSSVNAYASAPLLRAHSRLQALPVRAARRVAPVGPSMVHTPSRIDENDAVAVANLKRSLDRLVELPSAEPSDHVVSAPLLCLPHFAQLCGILCLRLLCCRPWCHCAPHGERDACSRAWGRTATPSGCASTARPLLDYPDVAIGLRADDAEPMHIALWQLPPNNRHGLHSEQHQAGQTRPQIKGLHGAAAPGKVQDARTPVGGD